MRRERPAIGATVKIPSHLEACKDLFGEYPSRILLTSKNPTEILKRAGAAGLRVTEIGAVGGNRLILNYEGQPAVDLEMGELETVWRRAFPKLFILRCSLQDLEILLCAGSLVSQNHSEASS